MEGALREGGREPGLKLIETLGWDGARLVRGERHLARLERSAAVLGWVCDVDQARAALLDGRDGPARLRLTLEASARIEVTAAPLTPVSGPWRIALAPDRLDADDPWLGVKTTKRALYDRARASLTEGVDEVLFLNHRGEVCEGTITNVFLEKDGGLITPRRGSGLLPGILREELLATGQAREGDLAPADLATGQLWVGNSLRGLIPAIFLG